METALTIAIIEAVLKYGPQIALTAFKELPDDPTPEDIRALKIDESEPFFKDG